LLRRGNPGSPWSFQYEICAVGSGSDQSSKGGQGPIW
jgi:hypothetical protein